MVLSKGVLLRVANFVFRGGGIVHIEVDVGRQLVDVRVVLVRHVGKLYCLGEEAGRVSLITIKVLLK